MLVCLCLLVSHLIMWIDDLITEIKNLKFQRLPLKQRLIGIGILSFLNATICCVGMCYAGVEAGMITMSLSLILSCVYAGRR